MTAVEKAAEALAQLSDQEWLQLKRDEDHRRAEQRDVRDLAKELRELRDRKRSPFFTTTEASRRRASPAPPSRGWSGKIGRGGDDPRP
jgi:hypothetical protein